MIYIRAMFNLYLVVVKYVFLHLWKAKLTQMKHVRSNYMRFLCWMLEQQIMVTL